MSASSSFSAYLHPHASAESAESDYARHVSSQQINALNHSVMASHKVHYGARLNGRVQDCYTGRWYFDCHRNGSLFNLGHCHPELVRLAQEAIGVVDTGSFSQVTQYRAALAGKLAKSTQDLLPGVVFTCNGGEAIDVAVQAARLVTGRSHFIAIDDVSYHGSSDIGYSLSGISKALCKKLRIDTSHVTFVPFNDPDAMQRALAGNDVAAVIVEPTPAQGGFPDAHPEYLQRVKALCEASGTLMVLDDIQVGLGSCGSLWSYQQDHYVPDIMVTGKGLGGGIFPVSVALMSAAVWAQYSEGQYLPKATTFGGSDLGCIVGARVVDITSDVAFLDRVRTLARRFTDGFADAPYKVTQRGLTLGLWTGNSYEAADKLARAGVLTIPTAVAPALPFRPILTIDDDEADEIIAIVRRELG